MNKLLPNEVFKSSKKDWLGSWFTRGYSYLRMFTESNTRPSLQPMIAPWYGEKDCLYCSKLNILEGVSPGMKLALKSERFRTNFSLRSE